jgi:hypothetical protein
VLLSPLQVIDLLSFEYHYLGHWSNTQLKDAVHWMEAMGGWVVGPTQKACWDHRAAVLLAASKFVGAPLQTA